VNAEAELIALRTMCRAAAVEIMEQWEAHCDADGFGPCNLLARLSGKLRPDLYPAHATKEEIARFNEIMHNGANLPRGEAE
jgi:hypothetical protein